MIIAGFQSGHDVGYSLLKDGIPIIHEELERFIREKEPLGDGLEMLFQRVPEENLKDIEHFSYGNPGGMLGKWASRCGKKAPRDKMNSLLKSNNGDFFVIGHQQIMVFKYQSTNSTSSTSISTIINFPNFRFFIIRPSAKP